ncbi:MAG: multicopper oxidase family protein [Streptosporangiales bacterium]
MKLLRVMLCAVLGLGLLIGSGAAALYFVVFAPVSTVGKLDFDRPLKIPRLAASHVDPDGTRVFHLTARAGTTELLPGTRSKTWGFNGSYLGPTLRAERGQKVRVEVTNRLGETTTVHWHGMHIPARFDGGPHQPIETGHTWRPTWRIDQPAATLWYHPHPHGETEDHINRGLAGMFLIDDPTSPVADRLPHQYGIDDIPVIVQDKSISSDGDLGSADLGDDLVVNGTPGPYLDVATENVRLRLLNASARRVYDFGLADGRAFTMIGTGGGLLHHAARMHRVQLSPGERADVVVQMTPGERITLRSYPPHLGIDPIAARFDGGQDRFDVLQLRAAAHLDPSPVIPQHLAAAPDLDVHHAKVRTFELGGRTINDKKMDMARIDETVQLGTTEVWQVTNSAGEYHNFHVHDVQFQVLSVDGKKPGPALSGWKDTIYMPPDRTVRLAMRFTDYADPDSPYMFHCHLLPHEDRGMMGQFVVVRQGQSAKSPHGGDHSMSGMHH